MLNEAVRGSAAAIFRAVGVSLSSASADRLPILILIFMGTPSGAFVHEPTQEILGPESWLQNVINKNHTCRISLWRMLSSLRSWQAGEPAPQNPNSEEVLQPLEVSVLALGTLRQGLFESPACIAYIRVVEEQRGFSGQDQDR